jgi:hypothetical protein
MMCGNHVEGISLAQVQISQGGLADARRILQNGIENRLQISRRGADDAQHLGGRGLLLQRLIPLAFIQRDLLTHTGSGRSAMAGRLWRIAALWRCRLAASRVSRFAACSGAPSHRSYPKAQDYFLERNYSRDLRPA